LFYAFLIYCELLLDNIAAVRYIKLSLALLMILLTVDYSLLLLSFIIYYYLFKTVTNVLKNFKLFLLVVSCYLLAIMAADSFSLRPVIVQLQFLMYIIQALLR